MLAIAKEMKLSETALVCASEKADFRIRFFTTVAEVDLCGHATIATWHLLHRLNIVKSGSFTQETLAGLLGIEIHEDGTVFMEQVNGKILETVNPSLVAEVLQIDSSELLSAVPPRIVSTGLRDIMVGVNSVAVLNNLEPNFAAMTKLSIDLNVVGMHVFALGDEDSLAHARNFAPRFEIDEESATGTSNGALLYYLNELGRLPSAKQHTIVQGSKMGKTSFVYGKLLNDTVWVGGRATLTTERDLNDL